MKGRGALKGRGAAMGASDGRGTGVDAFKGKTWASKVAAKGVHVSQVAARAFQKAAELLITDISELHSWGLRLVWAPPSWISNSVFLIVYLVSTGRQVEP